MAPRFLDTNILLRHVCQDDPVQSPKASAIVAQVERGELEVRTSGIVIFETVFTLHRSYKYPRDRIAAALLAIIELPGVILPGKGQYRDVFELFVNRGLGFADCHHVVLMRRLGLTDILSFDTDFDGIPGFRRLES